MTNEEKAAAFDALALAMTNQWHDDSWGWWCPVPSGGEQRFRTREEAVADLVAWAKRRKPKVRLKTLREPDRIPLTVVGDQG